MTESVIRQYLKFVSGRERNLWLEDDHIKIYVRKSKRVIDGKIIPILDIANVSNLDYDFVDGQTLVHQKKGYFREFMRFVEDHCPYDVIYIECVVSKRMREIITKNGYRKDLKHDESYFKWIRGSIPNSIQDLTEGLKLS